MKPSYRLGQTGMSLIELSIIMVVIGLLLILATMALPRLTERERLQTSGITMHEVSDAIVAFAATHSRLPCPDSDGDGDEDCASASGSIPYVNIGYSDALRDEAFIPLRYAVYRNSPNADLAAAANIFVPALPGEIPTINTDTAPPNPATLPPPSIGPVISEGVTHFGLNHHGQSIAANPKSPTTINDLDLCLALRRGRAATPNASFAHTLGGGSPVNAAFVIASGGVQDADGSGGDIAFDGPNEGATIGFETPARLRSTGYDDLVLAMSFGELESRLSCASATIAVNATANLALVAAHLVAQAEDLLWQAERAIVMDDIAVAQAGFALALAILTAVTAAADAAIAGTSCACPALPDNCVATAAAIAAAAAGVVNSVLAGVALDQAIRQQSINDDIYLQAIESFHTFVTYATELCEDAVDVEARGGQGDSP